MIFTCGAVLVSREVEYVGFYLDKSEFTYHVRPGGEIFVTWQGIADNPDHMRAGMFEDALLELGLAVETVVVTWQDPEEYEHE